MAGGRAPSPSQAFGFLNAFKPPGLSSTSYGMWVRRRAGASSLGHWGTLDPAACGVLVLALGRATRLIPYLPSDDKSYVFEMRVGIMTDSGDATGRGIRTADVPPNWAEALESAAASLVGPLLQTPPMFSAVKIAGRPLYKSARAGVDVERKARPVTIHRLRLIDAGASSARFAVDCSSGTYVRTLCEQIGERIGLPAHLGMLLRTRAGPFDLAGSSTPEEIERDAIACIVDPVAVLGLETIDLDGRDAATFAHGNPVDVDLGLADAPSRERDRYVLVRHDGALIGIGRAGESLEPVRVLLGSEENR
jgi:tRNA pseudouridine55 synthase